jgi:hypothetical protein
LGQLRLRVLGVLRATITKQGWQFALRTHHQWVDISKTISNFNWSSNLPVTIKGPAPAIKQEPGRITFNPYGLIIT